MLTSIIAYSYRMNQNTRGHGWATLWWLAESLLLIDPLASTISQFSSVHSKAESGSRPSEAAMLERPLRGGARTGMAFFLCWRSSTLVFSEVTRWQVRMCWVRWSFLQKPSLPLWRMQRLHGNAGFVDRYGAKCRTSSAYRPKVASHLHLNATCFEPFLWRFSCVIVSKHWRHWRHWFRLADLIGSWSVSFPRDGAELGLCNSGAISPTALGCETPGDTVL